MHVIILAYGSHAWLAGASAARNDGLLAGQIGCESAAAYQGRRLSQVGRQ